MQKYIHRRIDTEIMPFLVLLDIHFHYDCEVIILDRINVHPINQAGIVLGDITCKEQKISDAIYNKIIEKLNADGIC